MADLRYECGCVARSSISLKKFILYPNISFIPEGTFKIGFLATIGKVIEEVKPEGSDVGTG